MLDRLPKESKKFYKEFILLYKSHPCLWQIKSKDYLNRQQKEEAYRQLIAKLRELDPEADRNAVRKKIQGIRSTFHLEHKRLQNKESNVAAEQKPQSWCYDLLTFIVDQEVSDSGEPEEEEEQIVGDGEDEAETDISMLEDEPEIKIESELLVDELIKTDVEKDPFGNDVNEINEPVTDDPVAELPVENSEFNSKLIKEKMVNGKLMKVIPSTLFKRNCEDKYDYFGKHIAFSLREMDEPQSVIAQKLISEIIYRGQMKQLDLTSIQHFTDI